MPEIFHVYYHNLCFLNQMLAIVTSCSIQNSNRQLSIPLPSTNFSSLPATEFTNQNPVASSAVELATHFVVHVGFVTILDMIMHLLCCLQELTHIRIFLCSIRPSWRYISLIWYY